MILLDQCIQGDCRDVMRQLIAEGVKVQTIVTSPPYFGLRDYGVAGQIGLETTLQEFIATMVEVFDLARELLADDGTLWMNLGDSYASKPNGPLGVPKAGSIPPHVAVRTANARRSSQVPPGLKHKDMMGVPWRVALALQDAGWYLRQDIIWSKPNPMPESVRDRCTKAHEYLFLLSKSERYYFDKNAILEPCSEGTHARLAQNVAAQIGSGRANGGAKTNGNMKAVCRGGVDQGIGQRQGPPGNEAKPRKSNGVGWGHGTDAEQRGRGRVKNNASFDEAMSIMPTKRNKRSVWTIATESYSEAHFATFPQALVEPCVLAGSRPGDIVFDPFMGSGTTAQVAQRLGRKWLGAELNPEYIKLQAARTRQLGLELVA